MTKKFFTYLSIRRLILLLLTLVSLNANSVVTATWTDPSTGVIYEYEDNSVWGIGTTAYSYGDCWVVGVDESVVKPDISIASSIKLKSRENNGTTEYINVAVKSIKSISSSVVKSISIPSSITSISDIVCPNLQTLNIPSSVTYISGDFEAKEIIFPESITEYYITISGSGVEKINFPNDISHANHNIKIKDCENLQSLTVPEGVKGISLRDYSYCNMSLYNLMGLQSISLPKSLNESDGSGRGEQAYPNLVTVHFADGIEMIPDCMFYKCANLKNFSIPSSVKTIGYKAFQGCTSITEVNLPYGVEMIRGDAFYGCTGVTSLTIPKSVTYIGSSGTTDGIGAFFGCTNLEDIYVSWEEAPFMLGSPFHYEKYSSRYGGWWYSGGNYENAKLHLVDTDLSDLKSPSKFQYRRTEPWRYFRRIVSGGGLIHKYNITVKASGQGAVIYDHWTTGDGSDTVSDSNPEICVTEEVRNETKVFRVMTNWLPMEEDFTFKIDDEASLKSVTVGDKDMTDSVKIKGNIGNLTVKHVTGSFTINVKFSGAADDIDKTTLPGDVNGDGFVNSADVEAVANHIMGKPVSGTFDEDAADVNGDGKIDVADIVGIVNLIINTK